MSFDPIRPPSYISDTQPQTRFSIDKIKLLLPLSWLFNKIKPFLQWIRNFFSELANRPFASAVSRQNAVAGPLPEKRKQNEIPNGLYRKIELVQVIPPLKQHRQPQIPRPAVPLPLPLPPQIPLAAPVLPQPQQGSPQAKVEAECKIKFQLEPIVPALEPELDFHQAGVRTVAMQALFQQFSVFKQGKLHLNGQQYTPLTTQTEDISTKPVASCGSSLSREVILLDPEKSPVLQKHFTALVKEIDEINLKNETDQEEAIIKCVLSYVRDKIFFKRDNLEKTTDDFIKAGSWKQFISHQGHNIPVIEIDRFIEQGLGVCRHHGVVTTYILDRLIKLNKLQGTVQHMRDNIGNGAHVWVTFTSFHGKRWHIDTLWNNMIDFSTPEGIRYLENIYRSETVAVNELNRSQEVYKKIPLEVRCALVKKHLNSIIDKNKENGIYVRNSSLEGYYVIEYPALISQSKSGLRFHVTRKA